MKESRQNRDSIQQIFQDTYKIWPIKFFCLWNKLLLISLIYILSWKQTRSLLRLWCRLWYNSLWWNLTFRAFSVTFLWEKIHLHDTLLNKWSMPMDVFCSKAGCVLLGFLISRNLCFIKHWKHTFRVQGEF